MTHSTPPNDFFVVGGTMWGEAPSYIARPADEELYRLTLSGEYCNILAARQMGKSSLMVRTANRLHEQGVLTAIIDISVLGGGLSTADQWFFGFIDELALQLDLEADVDAWWGANESHNAVQKFNNFLRDVVLSEIGGRIVVFVDEIDSALGLDFTDDFFAAIRGTYNLRASNLVYERLGFVLIGVARPADLIRDRTRTPYNIGEHIPLTDFVSEELAPFRQVLETAYPGEGQTVLDRVLYWTNGQPYLTQKLCAALVTNPQAEIDERGVESAVTRLFLADDAPKESNLRALHDRIDQSPYKNQILNIYDRVLRGKNEADEERSIPKNEMKLTGLVRPNRMGQLEIRNRLYAKVFNRDWVKKNLPVTRNRRFAFAMLAVAVIAVAIAAYAIYRQSLAPTLTYVEQFEASASPDVRLTSLARLFELGDRSGQEAAGLYEGLSHIERLALFTTLSSPQNVAEELVIVTDAVYQDLTDLPADNEILTAMKNVLGEIAAPGAGALKTELEFWVKGREESAQENFEIAVSFFDSAWQACEGRGRANPGILFDRAAALAALGQNEAALQDLEGVWQADVGRQGEVVTLVKEREGLTIFWADHSERFPLMSPALAPVIVTPVPTETPTSTPTTALPVALSATPTETPVPSPTATVTPQPLDTFELAFASDRDGELGIFVMDLDDTENVLKLETPPGYDRAWWPTFCDGFVAAEVQDLDGLNAQWVYLLYTSAREPQPMPTSLGAGRLGVPRCAPNGQTVGYSAYIPTVFDGWTVVINELGDHNEYVPVNNPSFGYVSWYEGEDFFLSMTIIEDEFFVLKTSDYKRTEPVFETLAKGSYPTLSPNGLQFVYLCVDGAYLCIQDIGGESPRLLHSIVTNDLGSENIPIASMWSPDGLWIYFASAEDGDWDVYRIHPDGTNLQNLTDDWESNEIMPAVRWLGE